MQNTVKWRSDQLQPTHIWNPWSNETDANLEDFACTVRVLLFFPIVVVACETVEFQSDLWLPNHQTYI